MKITVIIILSLIITHVAFGQCNSKDYQKAQKLLQSSKVDFEKGDLKSAEKKLVEAINCDSTFTQPYYLLAELYSYQDRKEECISVLQKNYRVNYYEESDALYYLGMSHLFFGYYNEAKEDFDLLLKNTRVSGAKRNKANYLLEKTEFCISLVNNPVEFSPENLGAEVNSSFSEYLPTLTADEQTLLITVLEQKPGTKGNVLDDFQEDFYISTFENGAWTKSKNLGPPINTSANEGAQTVSPDGQYIYFTACMRPDSKGDCDIYISRKEGNGWSEPKNLGTQINSPFRESEPTFSSDGRTLYFVSDRPGGVGGYDIWMSVKNDNGSWRRPVNLGRKVNTDGNEMSPFIHADNQTLYFSSNGHMGLGGRDIFYVRKDSSGEWKDPVNIGYPINTYEDESDLIVSAKGNMAYFSRTAEAGYGGKDIYQFELYNEARPVAVTYLKGIVYDAKNNHKLEAALELIDLETEEVIIRTLSNPGTGEYLVCLPANREYALNVAKEGYLFHSEHFNMEIPENMDDAFVKDIPLQPIEVGQKVTLNNIFFETASWELLPESKAELNKLTQFMVTNRTLRIKINGHTDNIGSDTDNLNLSENRAKAVAEYLMAKNIESSRLKWQGFGETDPIADNSTEEGRAMNRRTEFEIIN